MLVINNSDRSHGAIPVPLHNWLISQLVTAKIGLSDFTSCLDILSKTEILDGNMIFLKAYCNYLLKDYDASIAILESTNDQKNVNFDILRAQCVGLF